MKKRSAYIPVTAIGAAITAVGAMASGGATSPRISHKILSSSARASIKQQQRRRQTDRVPGLYVGRIGRVAYTHLSSYVQKNTNS